MKRKAGTIDMTPTWSGLVDSLIAVLEDGTEKGKIIARTEFRRMATAADAYNKEAL